MNPKLLDAAIRSGCDAAIAAEPNLTKWDTVLGDGDCGEAVKGVSEGESRCHHPSPNSNQSTNPTNSDTLRTFTAIIKILNDGEAKNGSILSFLDTTTDAVDDMGGTLGAILGILLSAFTTALRESAAKSQDATSAVFADSLAKAAAALKTHTSAREGDRTVMDVLLPFADAFAESRDFHGAVGVAKDKAEATRFLRARFGRATYVAEAQGQELPDPGAWALYEWLSGMSKAIRAFQA